MVFLLTVLILLVCIDPSSTRADDTEALGFAAEHLDLACSPCQDFYRFANGGWIAAHPVPDDRSSWSAYSDVDEHTRATLRTLLDDLADSWETAPNGSGDRKLGLFFDCCIDTERPERDGIEPLRPLLARVEATRDLHGLATMLGSLHGIGIDIPFRLSATSDPDDGSRMIAELAQSGLTLPVAAWYTNAGEQYDTLRSGYRDLVQRTFTMLGVPSDVALIEAMHVLRLETALAGATMSREERRDPQRVTHRMDADQVHPLMAGFDWDAYFAALGIREPAGFNVAQPDFLRAVDTLLSAEPIGAWRSYLTWWLVRRASRFLDTRTAAIHHDLRSLWSGDVTPPPRRRLCEEMADFALGETLGRRWAATAFPPEAKVEAEAMVENLLAVLRERIEHLDWMTPATRTEALAKLNTLDVRIGYPDEAFDHAVLIFDEDASFLEMVMAVSQFRVHRDLERIGKPDSGRWALDPQRLTGAYIASRNSIEYPAAKFQPPFFDPRRDAAMNYGAIGATIAHEITHALDDEGRQYDADGNLRDWWSPEDAARFEAAAERLVEQFDGYAVLDSVRVNGRLTLGENIADLGGVTLAYHAWRRSLGGAEPETIGGFTGDQRFFLAWAHNWRESIRPEQLSVDVQRDEHAPSIWRVNGPLSNLPEFAEAFDCAVGAPMARPPDARVRIW